MNQDNKKRKHNRLKDNTKVLIFRLWMAGAVYFFLAFGSSLGQSLSGIDLIFMLSIALGFLTILVFNPIMYAMYDISKNGIIMNDLYKHHTVMQGVLMKLAEFIKSSLSVVTTSASYYICNILLTNITNSPDGTILLKGEPILFAVIYTAFYQLFSLIPSPFRNTKIEEKSIKE
ncbi:MAG: hypothetical protein WC162_07125 [Sphaerochaetaceae bacterium]